MSVTLTTYPVVTSSGKVRNIFAGFQKVELEFKREDAAIVGISAGVDSKVLISIATDISGSLNVGEWVYLYAVGSTYTYDGSYQIITVNYSAPNTEITIDFDFIELSSSGYCNYRQNWYIESKLVDPDNNSILHYPRLLQSDGSPDGVVKINTSMLVDFLKNELYEQSQEVTNGRQDCKVMYRESWREDDTAAFTLIDQEPIIIIFAAEDSEIEDFVTQFDMPKIYEGYPFWINMLHSIENHVGKRVSVEFDELDINEASITTDNPLINFSSTDFGILQSNFNDNQKEIEENTRYIRFNANTSNLADYETGDYDDTDYLTVNTP